jgi:hypothetical protein
VEKCSAGRTATRQAQRFAPLLDRRFLPAAIAERSDIWQMQLVDVGGLANYGQRPAINFSARDIARLWQIGLLRADVVASQHRLRRADLVYSRTDDRGWHWYADLRRPRRRRNGWGAAAEGLPDIATAVEPLFHPFRCYVLYHLEQTLRPGVSRMQPLYRITAYSELVSLWLNSWQQRSGTPEFLRAIGRWHDIAELAIAIEPRFYERLFGVFRRPANVSESARREEIARHWRQVRRHLRHVPLEVIETVRNELCFEAQRLDPNRDVHLLLRLASRDLRGKLQGHLGGAMVLLTMAELIRRAVEDVRRIQLPEEDEVGGGGGLRPNAKRQLFGATRILDDQGAAREFLRHHALHVGVRVRWYVEGDTEAAAIREILSHFASSGIEVLNLRGRVVQGTALAFHESLEEDLGSGVFSFVSLDGDLRNNVRWVQQAVRRDLVCGRIFIARPDFEFGNFDQRELPEVAWAMMAEPGAPQSMRQTLVDAVAETRNIGGFTSAIRRALPPGLNDLRKGEEWGRRLAALAVEVPQRRDGSLRPLVDAVRLALMFARFQMHQWTLDEYRLDPVTFEPVRRTEAERRPLPGRRKRPTASSGKCSGS